MASVELLDKLKLTEYYPQKLSFCEVIKLQGKPCNGCPTKYGVEVIRKLLMFDYKAIVSILTQIDTDKRSNNKCTIETKIKAEHAADDGKSVKASRKWRKSEPNNQTLHPMDVVVAVMNCCDDLLRQIVVEKMAANKLGIPILLPGVQNDSPTLLRLALRSLILDRKRDSSSSCSLNDTLVDLQCPVVSVIRVGEQHRSKSKLFNDILNINSFDTFFHRDCEYGSTRRTISNGSIEAAWFQSDNKGTDSKDEATCPFFTVLNLRGDARAYPKQTQFLSQSSTLVVVLIDSIESFKELFDTAFKNPGASKTNVIVGYVSQISPEQIDEENLEFMDDLVSNGHIKDVLYDWNNDAKMNNDDWKNEVRKAIFTILSESHKQMSINELIEIGVGEHFEFLVDEQKIEYEEGREKAAKIIESIWEQLEECKPSLLQLQGEPWKKIGELEREQRRQTIDIGCGENFISEKEMEKRQLRQRQCRLITEVRKTLQTFTEDFVSLKEETLLHYLNSCRIKLDARSRSLASKFTDELKKEIDEKGSVQSQESVPGVTLSQTEVKIANSVIGLEHILREIAQMYEAVTLEESRMKDELKKAPVELDKIHDFPAVAAWLLLNGQPLELMDGDASNVPMIWLKAVFHHIQSSLIIDKRVFVLSIIGIQSTGKSTLLNALFGLQFPVRGGKCTRGIFLHLVPVDKTSLQIECDYILVVDTEGLRSPELAGKTTFRDNELATFAIGLADATIINIKGETWTDMESILEVVAHALIRTRQTKKSLNLMPSCLFTHHNVSASGASDILLLGEKKQLEMLDVATKKAAEKEGIKEIKSFNHVVEYNEAKHSWYFPDLWSGRPPNARISQDYVKIKDDLKQHLLELMRRSSSKLTISGFFSRMSDLWNAMLHDGFVLCFRNTDEIMARLDLNDEIRQAADVFKKSNKDAQRNVCSHITIDKLQKGEEKMAETLKTRLEAVVERNFKAMKTKLQGQINSTATDEGSKLKYEKVLEEIKVGELKRISHETLGQLRIHTKKLENSHVRKLKDLKAKIEGLAKDIENTSKDDLSEEKLNGFDKSWQILQSESKQLLDERVEIAEMEITSTILGALGNLKVKADVISVIKESKDLFKTDVVGELPLVTEKDIHVVQDKTAWMPKRWVMDQLFSKKSLAEEANRGLRDIFERWELHFEKQREQQFEACHLEPVMRVIRQMLGISSSDVNATFCEFDELLSENNFEKEYIKKFIKFACQYAYTRSLDNSKIFITMTDPLADICERLANSLKFYKQKSHEAVAKAIATQICDYTRKSFINELDRLIEAKVSERRPTSLDLKSKRAFLRKILTDLGDSLTDGNKSKEEIFNDFMSYIQLAQPKSSRDFFFDKMLKYVKSMLAEETDGNAGTYFKAQISDNFGENIKITQRVLNEAAARCKGCEKEFSRIFKEQLEDSLDINFKIIVESDLTKDIVKFIDESYEEFLKTANSSETFMRENCKNAMESVFESLMGCCEKCPFCSAPCSESLQNHAGDHRANHYPMAISGTVDCRDLFPLWGKQTHGVPSLTFVRPNRMSLVLSTCQTLVGTDEYIGSKTSVKKYCKWWFFNMNNHPFKRYRELYPDWDIPHSQSASTSRYWKWFVAQFHEELATHYDEICRDIPEEWTQITWDEAKQSLDDPF